MKLLLPAAMGTLALTSALAAAAPVPTKQWRSGFETGFPGEWLDYDNGSFTASGTPNPGQNEAWTIVDTSDPLVFAGGHSYRGWPVAPQSQSHRAYPVLHCDIPSPLVNSFWVYLDIDYGQLSAPEWVHFATWGNNPDWNVHTMSVRDRKLEMAHLSWTYIGPSPQPDFPLKQWVRLTAYIHYQGAQGYIRVWQDGVPVLAGDYTSAAGTNLMRAHWGWYSSGSIDQGVQYNDEIQIWSLSEPLTDLDTEPPSPYQNDPPPGGGGGGASSSGSGGGASSSGSGGAVGSSGTAGAGGLPGAPGATADEGGCGCRLPPSRARPPLAWPALLALAGLLRRRRRGEPSARRSRAGPVP